MNGNIIGLAARLDEAIDAVPLTASAQALLEIAQELLDEVCTTIDCHNVAHVRARLVILKATRDQR